MSEPVPVDQFPQTQRETTVTEDLKSAIDILEDAHGCLRRPIITGTGRND